MRRALSLAALLIALSSCRTMTPRQQTGFLDRTTTVAGTSYPYVVYVPRDFDRARKWPVILFLHGAGERGQDGLSPSQVGLGSAIRFDSSRVPAIVVFPQVPNDRRWSGEPAEAAMAALEEATREFGGDRERTYVTGLSMGGYGTLELALRHPRRFAALVVVCGGVMPQVSTTSVQRAPLIPVDADPYAFVANALKNVPLWLFHGAADQVIPVDEARHLYAALKKAGADVRYTEYPEVGHNAWDRAYSDQTMWAWLFTKRVASSE